MPNIHHGAELQQMLDVHPNRNLLKLGSRQFATLAFLSGCRCPDLTGNDAEYGMVSNPLHALIEQLGQFVRAVWQCHHASTKEEMHETNRAWQTLIDPFWKTHRIPAEAIRRLADPAL